jgi:hypothetical protein
MNDLQETIIEIHSFADDNTTHCHLETGFLKTVCPCSLHLLFTLVVERNFRQ